MSGPLERNDLSGSVASFSNDCVPQYELETHSWSLDSSFEFDSLAVRAVARLVVAFGELSASVDNCERPPLVRN